MTSPADVAPVGTTDGYAAVQQRILALRNRIDSLSGAAAFGSALSAVTAGSAVSGTSAASATSATSAVSGATSGPTGDDVVARARTYLGVPYVFAGTDRSGIDCSGLVQRVYEDLGISLPRLSWDQAKQGTEVPSLAEARPGDVLGFGDPAHHVAIYVGGGRMIAAPQPGEVVKLQDVYETPSTIRRIIPTTTATPTATAGTGAVSGLSEAVQARAAQFGAAESRYGLPSGLLSAVAQAESGGNVAARSPAGAVGLMQLMPATAAALGVDPTDPGQAIDGAARLLRGHLQRFGSIPLALAAYNAGGGAVERYGGVPPYRETQDYVRKITAMLGISA